MLDVILSVRPEVLFAVRVLSLVQVMEIPLLKAWLQRVVDDGFTQALVDPGRVDFKFESYGPTNIPDTANAKAKGQCFLKVEIYNRTVLNFTSAFSKFLGIIQEKLTVIHFIYKLLL